ncbi:Hypothetical predicted protein, partial [Olea europaea subsp. europaea]
MASIVGGKDATIAMEIDELSMTGMEMEDKITVSMGDGALAISRRGIGYGRKEIFEVIAKAPPRIRKNSATNEEASSWYKEVNPSK